MALTATAQSALPPIVPSWDETIVPTLRKRLENESLILAKRISAASIASVQDNSPEFTRSSHHSLQYHQREDAPAISFSPRPSGIPRPSLHAPRPSISDDRPSTPTRTGSPFKRTRTLSQPKLIDLNITTASRPNDRAVSPNTPRLSDVKPTRIPVPRTRTASASGHAQVVGVAQEEGRNGGHSSRHHLSSDGPHGSAAQQKQPPRTRSPSIDSLAPRPSVDSEERPFEHWYRGEVSRNGGVGELRVGRRMEMLEIASYGHAPSRPPDHWRNGGTGVRRRRAGSTDVRLSFYMEADSEHARVLDEAPPTDIEDGTDFESDLERGSTESLTHVGSHPASSISSHQYPGLGVIDGRTHAPGVGSSGGGPRSRSASRTTQPSRIPTPSFSRQLPEPPRTPTPTQAAPPAAAEPESPKAASRNARRDIAAPPSHPLILAGAPQTPKRRAKSPAAISQSPSAKKSRSRAPPGSQARPNRDGSKRRSVGEYPVPTEEDMADAIPTWTQPVSPGGNWDDVVVPVVARKKGMDEFYTSADGRRQKRPPSVTPEPAPGTFGYDYSKYRPQLEDEAIPMADVRVGYEAEAEERDLTLAGSPPKGGDKQTEGERVKSEGACADADATFSSSVLEISSDCRGREP
ncbi:hypothetical protein F5148DRAFT_72770 [Russula earlei]|uniref:Uncharacterized protein n=1 Tax=Russula earlei TaxID=71964 RepID=A0ACC0U9D4_9AGAM|nr:hypothetical protein F5148DRAFT_72770 [Russula earlei]